jgi:hypothetical protein
MIVIRDLDHKSREMAKNPTPELIQAYSMWKKAWASFRDDDLVGMEDLTDFDCKWMLAILRAAKETLNAQN